MFTLKLNTKDKKRKKLFEGNKTFPNICRKKPDNKTPDTNIPETTNFGYVVEKAGYPCFGYK